MRTLDPIYFAPQRKLCGGWICWKDSPSPPPAPNYAAAAQQTSQGSVQAAIANNLMAHPDINTPLGSQTWESAGNVSVPGIGDPESKNYTPGFDVPTYNQTISMSPEGQNLYDEQMALSTGLLGLGNSSLEQTQASLGQPQDFSSVQDIADQSYGMQTARLDPQWQQNENMQKTTLANQGLVPGGEAYDNAMRTFSQGKNDAYNQARLSSIATMPQTYQLSAAQRMQPLTELNAIRTGAQPQMPQFQPTQYAGGAQGANMLGAAGMQNQYDMGLYNSQVGSQNSMLNGIMGIGAAAAGAYPWSDRRLKRDIVRIADDPRGFGWYLFRYLWNDTPHIGVMADEVPHAAIWHASGFMQVDYGRL